ncbi:META domain-containing protein [Polyangium aurulentum]|uniref:META domain-containing protein n=1 Tax=Polyangium aurulentum TaxID=2567896 RepID=UPI001469A7F7|nr:META domain-containing protein [Polyangium aurulentum]UQA55344.1 META domain-containing protein [Polyangium aurulentum]
MGYVLRSLLAMLPVVSLAAPAMARDENRLANTQWVLVAIVEGDEASLPVEGTEVTLEFRNDGIAAGRACNLYQGQYTVEGNALSFGDMATTLMLCPEEESAQEGRYYGALRSADSFEFRGRQLEIEYGDGKGTLVFARDR